MRPPCLYCDIFELFRSPLVQIVLPWGFPLVLPLRASWSPSQTRVAVSGKLIPHLLNHVFVGLDGAFHVDDFVELPRERPIAACCKNEVGVVKLLGGQRVGGGVRPFKEGV